MSAEALADLGLVAAALGAGGSREGVLEYTARGGRPMRATLRVAAAVSGEVSLFGSRADLGALAGRLRGAAAGAAGGRGGVLAEAAVSLDLANPANAAAVRRLLGARDPVGAWRAARLLGRRLDADGDVDLSVHRTTSEQQEAGGEIGAGLTLGAGYEHTTRTRALLGAWSLARGGALREREDCLAPAASRS
jgi:hypothetical protein